MPLVGSAALSTQAYFISEIAPKMMSVIVLSVCVSYHCGRNQYDKYTPTWPQDRLYYGYTKEQEGIENDQI